jgi:NitT/TauT family transport system permease protein
MGKGSIKVLTWIKSLIVGNLSVLLFIVAWEVLPRYGILNKVITPPFSAVVQKVYSLAVQGQLFGNIAISLQRAGLGFLLAAAVGITVGFLLGGAFSLLEKMLLPLLKLLEKINPFALFPVFILLLGIGEVSKVSMIYWVSQWPVIFNTILGIRGIDPLLIKTGRSMGASGATIFFKIILPAAVPSIFNGLKLGAQVAFIMVIFAEMLGASSGMGWLTINAQETYKMTQLFGATMCIAIIGLIINKIFRLIERRVLVWRETAFGSNEN